MSKAGTGGAGEVRATAVSRQIAGRTAEDRAAAELQRHGLRLLARNWRVARGPGRSGGEIDLVMRDGDGTLVFVEVRCRASARYGGAAASIGAAKQRALRFAAQCYLSALAAPPPCRFDVVTVEPDGVGWLRGVDLAA